jgi:RimJ/RimL family protein N-acetyltransferase
MGHTSTVRLVLDRCEVRSWRRADAPALARHGDNREIWLNLRDRFPHPYTLADAHAFLDLVEAQRPETAFAIAVGDEAVGGIGVTLGADVERTSAEIGYWLGEGVWGRGIASAAVRAVSEHAFAAYGLTRLFAVPYARNAASARVLEKAGYVLEGRLRRSAIKDGVVLDQLLYALVR